MFTYSGVKYFSRESHHFILSFNSRDLESVGITPSGDLSTDDQNIYNNVFLNSRFFTDFT
jgi:hypothetical protein